MVKLFQNQSMIEKMFGKQMVSPTGSIPSFGNSGMSGTLIDVLAEAKSVAVENKLVGTTKQGFVRAERVDVPPGFLSLNNHVIEAKSNDVVVVVDDDDDVPIGFGAAKEGSISDKRVYDAYFGFGDAKEGSISDKRVDASLGFGAAKEGSISDKRVYDAYFGFGAVKEGSIFDKRVNDDVSLGSLTTLAAGKPNEKSILEFPPKMNMLVSATEKLPHRKAPEPSSGYRRFAPANPKQIVGSITGADYMNAILNKGGSGTNKSKRLAIGSSMTFDMEGVSEVEGRVSRVEGDIGVLKKCKRRKRSDVSDIEARVALIKNRVSKIEEELAALRNAEEI